MKNFAPRINKKVIIVTNDSDFDSPIFEKPVGKGDEINKDAIFCFLNSDFCVHWFTQNCTLKHPKVTPIPIGLDYHTISRHTPCIIQEQVLNNIKQRFASAPFNERRIKCYGNYHFKMDGKYYMVQSNQICFCSIACWRWLRLSPNLGSINIRVHSYRKTI